MFEKWREKRATETRDKAVHEWQELRDATVEMLDTAQTFEGETDDGIVLKAGEKVFGIVSNVSLVEDRSQGGHWEGGSSGISVPIGSLGGRTIRYHVGATRGHYVQGTPTLTAIDTGTMYLTNLRVVFVGSRQTRECMFSKLVSCQHDPKGFTVLSVSNRQKPIVICYGAEHAGWVDFRLDLALAHYRNSVPELVQELKAQLAHIEDNPPPPPVWGPNGPA